MHASWPVKPPKVWERHFTLLICNVQHHVGLMCAAHFPPFPKNQLVLYLQHGLFVPRALKISRSLNSLFYTGKYKPQAWLPMS